MMNMLQDIMSPMPMFSKGRLQAHKSRKMYMAIELRSLATNGTQELHNNPPFPAWKDGLDELWN